jgi:hypothetical protein
MLQMHNGCICINAVAVLATGNIDTGSWDGTEILWTEDDHKPIARQHVQGMR